MTRNFFRSRWFFLLLGLVIGLAIIAFIYFLGMTFLRPHQFAGTVLEPPKAAADFSLTGTNGRQVRLSDLRGKVVLVFFGFTHCPDVCPATMQNLHQMLDGLGSQANQVQVVFITVDPERDTVEPLKAYVENFDQRALGLTGTLAEITQVAGEYGIFFQKAPNNHEQSQGDHGEYDVEHTAIIQLIDPNGNLRVVYSYDTRARALIEDVRAILRQP